MKQVDCRGLTVMVREGTTDENVIEEVIQRRVYLKRGFLLIEPGDHWLDLGGNIGTFSLLACAYGATVETFEPEPENFELLNMNLALNGFGSKVRTQQVAVVEGKQPEASLFLCKGDANKYRHTLKEIRGRERITVECVDVNDLLGNGANAIKLDIEGSELAMLSSGKDWNGIKKMAFEYHFDHDRSVPNFLDRMKNLQKCGFEVRYPHIPSGLKSYDFYPASKMVYCARK